MGLNNFNYVDGSGSTLLNDEEREGLKIKSITTHGDLNEYEQVNIADALIWLENKTFNHKEIAIRFKHRLVFIHPFPNGNGRHSRIIADILMERVFGFNEFSWGENMFSSKKDRMDFYIKSLHKADNGDFSDLLKFAKS